MAKRKNRRLFAKIESSYGVDPSLSATDVLTISELDVSPLEMEAIDRDLIVGYFGHTGFVAGSRMARVSFKVELGGSGVAGTAPRFGPLLRACAFSETITPATSVSYAPVSTALESVALAYYTDGRYQLLRGARGTFSLEFTSKAIPYLSFVMDALYQAPTDLAIAAGTFGDQAAPVIVSAQNTTPVSIHGYGACLESLTLDLASEVVYRDLAGCNELIDITDRKPNGTAVIDQVTQADKDYFGAITDQSIDQISLQHGQVAGNIVTLTMPTCTLGTFSETDSEGFSMYSMTYSANPGAVGNDEIEILMT